MSKKLITYRRWKEPYWIYVTYEKIDKRLWYIGANIHKSKRAQSDWYHSRKNKRARSAEQIPERRSHRYLIELHKLIKESISKFPTDIQFCIAPQGPRQICLAEFAERSGFIRYQQGEQQIWILTILES